MKMLHIPLTMGDNDFGRDLHTKILEKYSKLCIEISSARSWSQCQYTVCVPNMFAIVHHEKFEDRERGLHVLKRIWEAVLNAERVLSHPETDADVRASLRQVLDHMAWHKGQVARELFLVCQNGKWKAGDQQIRQLAFYLFGTPANTKHFLEDTFAHLADIVKRMVRNCKISKNLICSQLSIVFHGNLFTVWGNNILVLFQHNIISVDTVFSKGPHSTYFDFSKYLLAMSDE